MPLESHTNRFKRAGRKSSKSSFIVDFVSIDFLTGAQNYRRLFSTILASFLTSHLNILFRRRTDTDHGNND